MRQVNKGRYFLAVGLATIGAICAIVVWSYPAWRFRDSISGNIVEIQLNDRREIFTEAKTLMSLEVRIERRYAYIHGQEMTIRFERGKEVKCRGFVADSGLHFVPTHLRGNSVIGVLPRRAVPSLIEDEKLENGHAPDASSPR